MASNPTKILAYDLDGDLSQVFVELNKIKGDFESLDERFRNIDVDMLGEDEQLVLQDLIDAYYNDSKGLTRERMQKMEELLTQLQEDLSNIEISQEQVEMGTFNETFEYDTDGNVTKHTSTGERAFTVTYTYKEDGSGELVDSTKTFTDKDNNTVEIYKTYTYDTEGNITGINTITTVTEPEA